MSSVHDGHRDRLRHKFLQQGPDSFEPHEMLEMILYSIVPVRNTNDIAHQMIETFGSFSAVLDAPYEELVKMPYINKTGAFLLKLFAPVSRLYLSEKTDKGPTSADTVIDTIMNKFIGRSNEAIVLTLLDGKGKILFCGVVTEGTANSCDVYVRRIVGLAASYNATQAILAHNHPSGFALPSRADLKTTQRVKAALELVNVTLVDHMIIADGDFVSMAQDEGRLHTGIFEMEASKYDLPPERKAVAEMPEEK